MEENKNIITKYPEGIDFLEKKLNIMGLPRILLTGLRKKLIRSLILSLARQ